MSVRDDLTAVPESTEPGVTLPIVLDTPLGQVRLRVTTSAGLVPLAEILPLARRLDRALIQLGLRHLEAQELSLACGAGCDACCRHLVAVTPLEAVRLAEVVDAMPEERRAAIETRLAAARERAESSGFLGRAQQATTDQNVPMALEYFDLGIPCPFLEDRRCGIYEERPFACREHMVHTDPGHCQRPREGGVAAVFIPVDMVAALGEFCHDAWSGIPRRMPLPWALDWARRHPELHGAAAPGAEMVQALLQYMSDKAPRLIPRGEAAGEVPS
jgi:Fe-S-cluster containining protein